MREYKLWLNRQTCHVPCPRVRLEIQPKWKPFNWFTNWSQAEEDTYIKEGHKTPGDCYTWNIFLPYLFSLFVLIFPCFHSFFLSFLLSFSFLTLFFSHEWIGVFIIGVLGMFVFCFFCFLFCCVIFCSIWSSPPSTNRTITFKTQVQQENPSNSRGFPRAASSGDVRDYTTGSHKTPTT